MAYLFPAISGLLLTPSLLSASKWRTVYSGNVGTPGACFLTEATIQIASFLIPACRHLPSCGSIDT